MGESFEDWATKLTIEKKKTTYLNNQLGEARQKIAELEQRIDSVVQDVVRNDQESKRLLDANEVRSKASINDNDANLREALHEMI